MGSTVDRILSGQQDQQPPPNFDQKPGKVDSILTAKPSVDDILSGARVPYDPNRLAPREVPITPDMAGPSRLQQLLDILKEQGLGLVQFGKYAITTPGFNAATPIVTSGKVGEDILLAAQGDKDAELRLKRGLNGAALTASTLAGEGMLAGIPRGAALIPRFARWMAAQEAGAATYGAIQPLDSNETRSQVIKDDLIQFPIAGAVLHGIFKGTGKLFKGFFNLDPAVEDALKNMGKPEAEKVGKAVAKIVNEAGDVPPSAEPAIHSAALNDVVSRLSATKEEVVNNQFNALRNGDLSNRVSNLASLVEQVRGKPLNLAEFHEFAKDLAEDGEHLTIRKWAQKVETKPTGATAKMAETPKPGEPDFTVETNVPPTPTGVSKASLGPISEDQFQQELSAITPKAPAGVDEEAAARARVEAARNTPFPDIPARITPIEPLPESVVRNPDGTLKPVYHGTSKAFDQFDVSVSDPEALFGPGIYTTDSPVIAEGYAIDKSKLDAAKHFEDRISVAEKRVNELENQIEGMRTAQPRATEAGYKIVSTELNTWKDELAYSREIYMQYLNKLGSPNLRPAYLDIKNPFNVEKFYTKEEYDAFAEAANLNNPLELEPGSKIRGEEIYNQTLRELGNKRSVNAALERAGFDGITHVGGRISGGQLHQVYIAFSPDQVHAPWEIDLQRVMSQAQQAPGPIANGAVADAVADGVVASTKTTELMDPVTESQAERLRDAPVNSQAGMAFWDGVGQAVDEGLISPDLGQAIRLAKALKTLGNEPISKILRRMAGEKLSLSDFAKKYGTGTEALHTANADDLLDLAKIAEGYEKEGTNPLARLGQLADDPGAGPEAKRMWSTLDEEQLNAWQRIISRFLTSDAGGVTGRAAARIAALSLSGVSFYAADQEDDPKARAILNTVGGILAVGALGDILGGKITSQWIKETKIPYSIVKSLDLPAVATDPTKKGIDTWHAATQWGTAAAKQLERKLPKVFPDVPSNRAAVYSLDEGPTAPEWFTLTKDQQNEVAAQSVLNNQMGRILQQLGIIKSARAFYIRHLFQDRETQSLWYSTWESIQKSGQFAKARQFETIREAEKWAAANGFKPPVMDVTKLQSFHMIEASRAIANVKMQKYFESLGVLVPFDPVVIAAQGPNVLLRDKLRQVRVANIGGAKMAPDDVAEALERTASHVNHFGKASDFVNGIDAMKSQAMRSIMFWAIEHGINVYRGVAAIDGTGSAYRQALTRIRNSDPLVLEVSKYADLFQRPDFGPDVTTWFDKALAKIGQSAPTLEKLGIAFNDYRARGEHRLWDEQVPALGMAVWSTEMHKWTQRTGGKFLLGSPEYQAAALKAGSMANNAMGKIPKLVQDPAVQQALRIAFFSPNWTRGRLAISANAYGEAMKIASGEINPNQANYLGYKLRSVLIGMVLTTALSLAITGRYPTFNPNTLKFYANSGIKDKNGRELGIDISGWFSDDLKIFNDPFAYIRDRQSPLLRQVGTQVNGRDVFGRTITGMERLDNLLQSAGPPGEAISAAASVVGGAMRGESPTAADALRAASNIGAVGNISSLPVETDVIVGKYAAKILRDNGLPDDRDRVYQLAQIMKQNYAQTHRLYGKDIATWIGYQQRAYTKRPIPWLWQQAKVALHNATKD